MTRNLSWAPTSARPGATGGGEFVTAAGAIFRQLEATNFPQRAKGLADEIQARKPDLVGLQEVALWRKAR